MTSFFKVQIGNVISSVEMIEDEAISKAKKLSMRIPSDMIFVYHVQNGIESEVCWVF